MMFTGFWDLRTLKSQPTERCFQTQAPRLLCFYASPPMGLWKFVLGIARLSQGSFLCLYHLAGKGLLMTNLRPRGTEPRRRSRCCSEGCLWSPTAFPKTPSSSPIVSWPHSNEAWILNICSKIPGIWRGRPDSRSS